MKASPETIAQWMLEEVKREGCLYQEEAVQTIIDKFGEEFSYDNENGNSAIRKDVLKAFKDISGDSVVWERGERMWRRRENYDEPGRAQY